jgi:hypothetical protein
MYPFAQIPSDTLAALQREAVAAANSQKASALHGELSRRMSFGQLKRLYRSYGVPLSSPPEDDEE